MSKKLDLTGQKFDRWTAIKSIPRSPGTTGHTKWLCECDCGTKAEVDLGNLTSGISRSCGCLQSPNPIQVGHKFYRLTVVSKAPNRTSNGKVRAFWHCICDCGKSIEVNGDHLREREVGMTKSCGCLKAGYLEDLTGRPIGKWTVLNRDGFKNPTRWICQCECGQQKSVTAESLKNDESSSCGCDRAGKTKCRSRKEKGLAGKNKLLRAYKHGAKQRNLEFDLQFDGFVAITSQNCHYCGTAPRQIVTSGNKDSTPEAEEHSKYVYNGIDRIDNNEGYIAVNILPCCWACNRLKGSMEQRAFLEQVDKIYAHQLSLRTDICPSALNASKNSPKTNSTAEATSPPPYVPDVSNAIT